MRRCLFDTGIAGDYVNRRHGVWERAREEVARGNRIGIGMPVLAELYFGVERSATRDRNLQRLRLALSTLRVWPFTEEAAEQYGRIAAELRRIGRRMQVVDVMIAAIALSLGKCTVVSKDSDLSAVPGLTVENWAVSN
jgi:tRNA(fMet)-specific endonuclease VapC